MVMVENVSAGLIISLINKHIMNGQIIEQCMQDQE